MKKDISYGAAYGEDRSQPKNNLVNQVSERCYISTWTLEERKKKNSIANPQSMLTKKWWHKGRRWDPVVNAFLLYHESE